MGHRASDQITSRILDRNFNKPDFTIAVRAANDALDTVRNPRSVDVRLPAMFGAGQIGQDGRLAMPAHRTEQPTMTAGYDIAAWARIAFLHLAGGKNLLLLDNHHAGFVPALIVLPNARGNILN